MLRIFFRRGGGVLCLLLLMCTVQAQYLVSGGKGSPLLALDDSNNRLQVYLVYGMENVEIRYTPSSSSYQWYRFKNKALDGEKIPSFQEGATTLVRGIEEGYGYYVMENEAISSARFVWIIDYSRYAFDITSLKVSDTDPCTSLHFEGTADMKTIDYCIPSGQARTLEREFEVTYQTLSWSEADKHFSQENVKQIMKGNPFVQKSSIDALKPPLCDTEIRLSGDLFARHFGVEKSASTGMYQAVAVDVHTDTTLYINEGPSMVPGDGTLTVPAEVHFSVIANEPVAALFTWKINRLVKDGDPEELVRFPGQEIDYTFNETGDFEAFVEVSDRMGKCATQSDVYTFSIVDSYLDVPNAFSPGTSPGINDEFRVAYRNLVKFKCWIFNRWGAQIYYWSDPTQGWDGKKSGKYVTPGVYFYVIEATGSDGKPQNKKGSINILRSKEIQDEVIK